MSPKAPPLHSVSTYDHLSRHNLLHLLAAFDGHDPLSDVSDRYCNLSDGQIAVILASASKSTQLATQDHSELIEYFQKLGKCPFLGAPFPRRLSHEPCIHHSSGPSSSATPFIGNA